MFIKKFLAPLFFFFATPGVPDAGESFKDLNNSGKIFSIPNGVRKCLIGPEGVVW